MRPRLALIVRFRPSHANGSVSFKTIYPGWYTGRPIHIHFKVRTFQSARQTFAFTSQLFFDDAVSDQVMAQSPYSSRGTRDTRNSDDGIYDGNGAALTPALTGDPSSGYTGTFDVGLSGLPSSGGSDSSVHAALQAVGFRHNGAGARLLSLKLKVNEQVSADAQLRRGGRLLARRRKAGLAAGTRTIEVPIAGHVDAGPAALKLDLADAAGNTRVVRRQLRVPAAG